METAVREHMGGFLLRYLSFTHTHTLQICITDAVQHNEQSHRILAV